MTRPLLSLVMPVKNEAKSLRAVLESLHPFVDRWTIWDTGSTDETKEIVLDVMGDLPGRLVETPAEPFPGCTDIGLPDVIDYALARNRLRDIDKAADNPAVFQLIWSGDEYLVGGKKLRSKLEERREAHLKMEGAVDLIRVDLFQLSVVVNGTAQNPQPRIFRTDDNEWHYVDEMHEYPVHPAAEKAPHEMFGGVSIEHVVADPEAKLDAIWEKHIPVLKAMLERNPNHERALTFLAQSYASLLPHFQGVEKVAYTFEAMSLLMRRLALPFGTPAEQRYVERQYLDFARFSGAYFPEELLRRAEMLSTADDSPETALLHAQIAANAGNVPSGRVYELAKRAADLAEKPREVSNSLTLMSSADCAWKAHLIAAAAAKKLAMTQPPDDKGTTFDDIMRDHIKVGIAAGGPAMLFAALVSPPPAFPDVPPPQEAAS